MLKKSTIEKIIAEDMAAIWSILTMDEKHQITDNFVIHNFKKNQIIYAEKDEPQFLWTLMKGKVKMFKDGIGVVSRFCVSTGPFNTSAIAPTLHVSSMSHRLRHLSHRHWAPYL